MPSPQPAEGYETRDANAQWIVRVVLLVFVFGLAVQFILGAHLSKLKQMPPPADPWQPLEPSAHAPPSAAPFPRLQVAPPLDLKAFRAREDAELSGYGWINRTSGTIRIPVERAMELVLAAGLPVRGNSNASRTGPSTYQLMQQRPLHREPEIQGEK